MAGYPGNFGQGPPYYGRGAPPPTQQGGGYGGYGQPQQQGGYQPVPQNAINLHHANPAMAPLPPPQRTTPSPLQTVTLGAFAALSHPLLPFRRSGANTGGPYRVKNVPVSRPKPGDSTSLAPPIPKAFDMSGHLWQLAQEKVDYLSGLIAAGMGSAPRLLTEGFLSFVENRQVHGDLEIDVVMRFYDEVIKAVLRCLEAEFRDIQFFQKHERTFVAEWGDNSGIFDARPDVGFYWRHRTWPSNSQDQCFAILEFKKLNCMDPDVWATLFHNFNPPNRRMPPALDVTTNKSSSLPHTGNEYVISQQMWKYTPKAQVVMACDGDVVVTYDNNNYLNPAGSGKVGKVGICDPSMPPYSGPNPNLNTHAHFIHASLIYALDKYYPEVRNFRREVGPPMPTPQQVAAQNYAAQSSGGYGQQYGAPAPQQFGAPTGYYPIPGGYPPGYGQPPPGYGNPPPGSGGYGGGGRR